MTAVARRWPERTDQERFMEKVDVIGDETCWEWTGYRQPEGYGRFRFEGRSVQAHRVAYILFVGEIPDGLTIDHLCRNRGCVNPDHLEPVTAEENKRRGESLAQINATKTHCVHGHEFTPANTYVTPEGWRRCRACHRASEVRRHLLGSAA